VGRFPAIASAGTADYALNVMKSVQALICLAIALWPASLYAAPLPMMDAMSVMDAVHAKVGHNDDLNASLVGEGTYAVAFWKATNTHSAGAALLRKTSGNWHVLKVLPAAPKDPAVLENLGVPAAQAKALVIDIAKGQ
jgi:hypothetical protein